MKRKRWHRVRRHRDWCGAIGCGEKPPMAHHDFCKWHWHKLPARLKAEVKRWKRRGKDASERLRGVIDAMHYLWEKFPLTYGYAKGDCRAFMIVRNQDVCEKS